MPLRRRGWRGARYRVEILNEGNTPINLGMAATESDEQLRIRFTDQRTLIEPGVRAEIGLRARTTKLIWFGKPVTWPIRLTTTAYQQQSEDNNQSHELDGELVQIPIFPRWLLALLALLLALLLFWLTLVRPAVQSAARQAADDRAQEIAKAGQVVAPPRHRPPNTNPQQGGGAGGGQGQTGQPQTGGSGGQQSSKTIEVRTNEGRTHFEIYDVPAGKIFRITDLLVGNHQGDEGVLTIFFGERIVTTIALETFRNQDYHWVTPIDIPENGTIKVMVRCTKPGTPATGQQARNCLEMANVSGKLDDLVRN